MTTEDLDIRIRILKAAKKLFALHGFDGTSVRQICDEAGANVALISYYFGGKENLFMELMSSFSPNQRVSEVSEQLDPVEGVKLVIREVTLFRSQNPEFITIVQQEILKNSPRLHLIYENMSSVWLLLRNLLEQGRRQGRFDFRSLDTAFLSIVGTLIFPRQSTYWTTMCSEEEQDIESVIEDLTQFVLSGLQCKE